MSTSINNPIVLNYHDSVLRRSDFEILAHDDEWLSDSIIGFYLQYLENEKYPPKWPVDGSYSDQDFLFVSPEATQYMKSSDDEQTITIFLESLRAECYRFIFFPLNDSNQTTVTNTNITSPSGSHWSLLIYSRHAKSFFHYDSLNNYNTNHALRLATKLRTFLGSRQGVKNGNCLAQRNGYDCGIHVLCNIDNITEYLCTKTKSTSSNSSLDDIPTINEDVVQNKRRALHSLVESLMRSNV